MTPSKHRPFVPESLQMKEFTLRAIVLGLIMCVVLGAANAYLGLRAGQTIEGDVQTFGGNIEVYGHVTGDVFVIGGDLTLAPTARVDGDVVCFGGTLREEPGSSVGGKRVTSPRTRYSSPE